MVQGTGSKTQIGNHIDSEEYWALSPENRELYNKLIEKPNRLLEIYVQNSEMCTIADLAAWWQGEFLMANKERQELKEELKKLKGG